MTKKLFKECLLHLDKQLANVEKKYRYFHWQLPYLSLRSTIKAKIHKTCFFLLPHMILKLQPLDQRVIQNVKWNYRWRILKKIKAISLKDRVHEISSARARNELSQLINNLKFSQYSLNPSTLAIIDFFFIPVIYLLALNFVFSLPVRNTTISTFLSAVAT